MENLIAETDDLINDLLLFRKNEIQFRGKLISIFNSHTSRYPKVKSIRWLLLLCSQKSGAIVDIGAQLRKSRERQQHFERCLQDIAEREGNYLPS